MEVEMEDNVNETTAIKGTTDQADNVNIDNTDETAVLNDNTVIACDNIPKDNGQKKTISDTGKWAIYKNLAVVSSSFLVLFTAYQSLQNLQSSINVTDGLGVIGLTVVYLSLIISSAFLPPLLIAKLGMKWTMVVSVFGYMAYISAAFRATWGSIIPTSVLLGIGAANLWTAKMAFVTELARRYSDLTESKLSNTLDRFFGIFFAVFQTG